MRDPDEAWLGRGEAGDGWNPNPEGDLKATIVVVLLAMVAVALAVWAVATLL